MAKAECVIWVAVNEDGEYGIGPDEDVAADDLSVSFGGKMRRLIRLTAMIEPPVWTEVDLDVPDEAGHTVEVEAENGPYSQEQLDGIASYYNWARINQDSDGNLAWNSSLTAETGWQPVTHEQIATALNSLQMSGG